MEETEPRCRCNGSAATHYITARALNGRIRLCDSLFIAMFGLTDSPLLSLSKPLHGPYSTLYYQTSSNIRTSVIEQLCLPWSKIPFLSEHCEPPKWKEIMYRNRYISVWYFAVSEQNSFFFPRMYEVALPPYILEICNLYKAHSFDQINWEKMKKD